MEQILDKIDAAPPKEIEQILKAALARYRDLYPEWDISTLSLEKAGDKNEQLDRVIDLLRNMKES